MKIRGQNVCDNVGINFVNILFLFAVGFVSEQTFCDVAITCLVL